MRKEAIYQCNTVDATGKPTEIWTEGIDMDREVQG
jgi:hypothetical protein